MYESYSLWTKSLTGGRRNRIRSFITETIDLEVLTFNYELRQDSGFELREDGSREVRE